MLSLLKKLGVIAWNTTVAVVSPTEIKFKAVGERELREFVLFLKKKTGINAEYKVSAKFLSYGEAPRCFRLTTEKDNTIVLSFFLCGDPTFSAVTFTLAREFFGKERTHISESFLYREDGTVCVNWHTDFAVVYREYLHKILRTHSGVKVPNTELN